MDLIKKYSIYPTIELAYLWVEDYGIIKDQGFNFNRKYTFHYNISTNNISCEENENYIEKFFGENISNITAIVGQNGSGKSFILSNLHKLIFNMEINHVAIFIRSDNSLISIKPNSIFKGTISEINNPQEWKSLTYDGIFREFKIFYYDAIGSQDYVEPIIKSNIEASGEIKVIKKLDMIYMMKFLREEKGKIDNIIKLSLKHIKLELIDNYKNYEFNDQSTLKIQENKEEYIKFNLLMKKLFEFIGLECSKNEKKFNLIMLSNILYDLYRIIEHESELQVACGKYLDIEVIDLNNYIEYIERIFNFIEKYYKEEHTISNKITELKEFWKVLDKFEELLSFEKKDSKYIFNLSNSEKLNEFIDILNKYDKASQTSYFSLQLVQEVNGIERYLSSGEEVMFKMYARLYNKIKFTHTENEEQRIRCILLLLDKTEAYLHPEWQRQFISKIITFFDEFFGRCNIQMIISSNNPFFISDLPKNNTILLEENEKGNIRVKSQKEYEKTFAQNIHTLLTKSFFMNGTIGEFAKEKINAIINAIKPIGIDQETGELQYNGKNKILESLNIDSIKDIEKLIDMIGEPIINFKLKEMYYSYIKNSNTDLYKKELENKISELQEELSSLNKE